MGDRCQCVCVSVCVYVCVWGGVALTAPDDWRERRWPRCAGKTRALGLTFVFLYTDNYYVWDKRFGYTVAPPSARAPAA